MTGSQHRTLVIADQDPVMRLARYALEGPGAVTSDWVSAYFSPESVDPQALRDLAGSAGAADSFVVRAGQTGSESELLELIPQAQVVLYRRAEFTRTVLQHAPALRLIQRLGARPDGIDLAAAVEAGVTISCVPRPTLARTAEHAILLMLAVSKRLLEADAAVRRGQYDASRVNPLDNVAYNWTGMTQLGGLFEKTLGIVGLGEVGTLVAQRARAFATRILYNTRHRPACETEAELNVEYRPFDELLRESDYISVHASDSAENVKLFDARAFGLMKRTAVFVNTSRGRLVDESALYHALTQGGIAGAGLDVHSVEPRPAADLLAQLPNVILTPHLAGGSKLGLLEELAVIFENCGAAIQGRPIRYVFQPGKGESTVG